MADDLDDLHRLAPGVDREAAVAAFRRRRRRSRSLRRGAWAAAAVGVLVAGTVAVVATLDDGTPLETGPAGIDGPVTFEVLTVTQASDEMGTLRSAVDDGGYANLWKFANTGDARPGIDFEQQVVVSITIPDNACPPELTAFQRDADVITPVFVEPPGGCDDPLIPKTYVVALDWASLGDAFTLRLPADDVYDFDEQRLRVERGGDVPTVWAQEPTDNMEGLAAIVGGTLRYDAEHDCFSVGGSERWSPVVWPAGTVGTADGPGVILPDGQVAQVGDVVAGGGGYYSLADAERFGIPPACHTDTGEIAVYNPNAEVRVNPPPADEEPQPPACAEIEAFADQLVNVGIDYDYEPSISPEDLYADVDMVLTGTLTGRFESQKLQVDDERFPSSFVGYEVDVDAVFKSPPAIRLADELYVWLEHGLASVQAQAFEDVLVAGLRVVVFAYESPTAPGFAAAIEGFAIACPNGPPIGRVGTVGTWTDLTTLDDLIARLEAAAAGS